VAAPGSLVVFVVVKPMTTISSSRVVTFVGSVGPESQDRSREPHPVVGGTVHPSRRAVFERWATILVVTTRRSCLVGSVAQG
jgi:hypothetical protein